MEEEDDLSWFCFLFSLTRHPMAILPKKLCSLTFMLILIIQKKCVATDLLTTGQMLRENETIVSSDGIFALGFFKPGKSTNQYVGIWYKNIPVQKILWVANREDPLTTTSGALQVTDSGLLVILNETKGIVWSSSKNSRRSMQNPVAQLLDSGNFVVRAANDDRPENFIWQGFDYPTDTLIPGMKPGWNLLTRVEKYLSTWENEDNPAPGMYTYHLDPTGYPQVVMKRGSQIIHRFGPYIGIRFSGGPNEIKRNMFKANVSIGPAEIFYWQETVDKSFYSVFSINWTGIAERWDWVEGAQMWLVTAKFPRDDCDDYGYCGPYGRCSVDASPYCKCLDKFKPKDPRGWERTYFMEGCIRKTNLSCQGDKFLKYSGIKLPDARKTWHNAHMTMQECQEICLQNCTCMAYTQLNTSSGIGCLIWFDDLIDIKSVPSNGQDIYIRIASSETENALKWRNIILIASFLPALGIVLIGLGVYFYTTKSSNAEGKFPGCNQKNSELPLFALCVLLKATNNFSVHNKIGEGGFGVVYKGMLKAGQEIAVKRLSKDSMQGLDEFKNEIIFIAKLQHRNLVRLLGGCIHGEENMLVYEYMPNKSLDTFLFDKKKCMLLDWKKRFHIINGIARGLLYLHQDSTLRIIHRDLKASNVLLDADLNPKISDFGMARSFGGNETEAKTCRIVGTYGYMSPEYAIDGLFSTKSDVFSFGVLVLEIVTGIRNRAFCRSDHNLNLLGHAWTLYKEGRELELIDPSVSTSFDYSEIIRVIHVGLLCVQQKPEDRPSMSTVVLLLSNESAFPQAKQPGFFTEREIHAVQSSMSSNAWISVNEVTISMAEPR